MPCIEQLLATRIYGMFLTSASANTGRGARVKMNHK